MSEVQKPAWMIELERIESLMQNIMASTPAEAFNILSSALAAAHLAGRIEQARKDAEMIGAIAASNRDKAADFVARDMDAAHSACMDRVWAMDECADALRAEADKMEKDAQ